MKGHTCDCCDKFYEAIDCKDHINSCSRHRAHFTPPSTAPDFWKVKKLRLFHFFCVDLNHYSVFLQVGFDEEETCPPADSDSEEGT